MEHRGRSSNITVRATLALATTAILAAGCARAGTAGGSGPTLISGGSGTATTATPGPSVSASSDLGTPGPVSDGRVTVSTDRTTYGPSATVTVTIANGLGSEIWSLNHQTDCSIVTVLRSTGSAWVPVGPCLLAMATFPVATGPGRLRVVSLTPAVMSRTGNPGQLPGETTWALGRYRVVFAYTVGAEPFGGTPATVTATFAVVA